MMDPYELLMAQMAQNQSTLLRPGIRPQSALGEYGSNLMSSLGFGPEAIQQMNPGSWGQNIGEAVGLEQPGINNLESSIAGFGGMDLPALLQRLQSGSERVVNNVSQGLDGLNTALTPAATDLMGRSQAANQSLDAVPSLQGLASLSPFQQLPEGTGVLEAMNSGTPWASLVNEDRNAGPVRQPPTLQAILDEANRGTTGPSDPTTHSFDMGALPPEELFRLSGGGGSGIGFDDYAQLASQLPGAKRVTRQVAAPTDFSSADAAFEASKPTYEEHGPWSSVLQGMAAAALRNMGGDTGDMLLAAGLGALGGLGSGNELENERKDLATAREQQWQGNKANYEITKSGERRAQQQEGYNATYDSDVNYQSQVAGRQQDVINMLTHGLDAEGINQRESTNNAIQIAMHNQQMALDRWKMTQPSVDVNQYGITTTTVDPKTGKRTMTIDNSPWVQRLQMQAMMKQLGGMGMLGGGAGLPGMDFGNDGGKTSAPQLLQQLSTYYFMNPVAANSDLGEEFLGEAGAKTRALAGTDSKQFPQMMANNIYSFIAPILADESHPLHNAILARMGQMQGMF
jgi:hypothetical protein